MKKLKKIKIAITNFKIRFLYEPFAEIILIFLNNTRTAKEFNIGYAIGDKFDAYLISYNIYLFGKIYE
jgi:hypothetical protein